MFFRSARLRDYRNFGAAKVSFSPRLNILLGDNGQGKTNILEALYLTSQGRSFRYGGNEALIKFGGDQAHVETLINRKDLDYEVKLLIQKTRKSATVNEKRMTGVDIRKLFPAVLFSPESLSAIKEGADHRRELVDDFLVTHHTYNADLIADFRKTLKTRNRVLKQFAEGLATQAATMSVMESVNPRFLKLAGDVTEARVLALRELTPDIQNAFRYVSGDNTVDISVEMVVSGQNASNFSRKNIDDAIQQRAQELRDAELGAGTSLVGPHKHEILFLYQQKDSRFYCSQGQQRAIILAFKMAQIVYHRKAHGFYPVLMLDDVLSELDIGKRKALISFLHEINTQVFLTTADLALPASFQLEDSAVIRIAGGEIQA